MGGKAIVTTFEFDDSNINGLNFKKFDSIDKDWTLFVVNNRNKKFKDINDELCNQDNKYDIVYVPVADDNVLVSIVLFLSDVINMDTLMTRFEYKKCNDQYSFHTNESLKLLTKVGAETYNKTVQQEVIIQYLITNIIKFIAEDFDISIEKAMDLFYTTDVSKKLEDVRTGYYKDGASYLYEIVKEELNKKNN